MIIVLSDLHLGYEKCNRDDILRFLDSLTDLNIDKIILLGDIFDFWRRNNASSVTENSDILQKMTSLNTDIYYVIGNHDYYMLNLAERYENFPFIVSKHLRLSNGGSDFYFVHGYELEVLSNLEPLNIEDYERFSEKMCFAEDIIGKFAGYIWKFIQGKNNVATQVESMRKIPHERENIDKIYKLVVSEGKKLFLGVKPEEKLIFGHTHRPFITNKGDVANTGSWVDDISKNVQNGYIEIIDGNMKLKFFK